MQLVRFFFRKKSKPNSNIKKYSIITSILLIVALFFGFKYSYKFENLLPSFSSTNTIKVISEESLINEVKNVNKIIPLEITLSETMLVDKSFGNLDIFKKQKTITFFAKCSYSIDLSQLTNNDIILNNKDKEITLTLPSPQVYSIDIDDNKTKYSDPELGLLRFGDIELSSEEYGTMRSKLLDAFTTKMNDDNLHNQAIANASLSLESLISNLTGESYTINIKLKNAS